jgi:hypothetical protein
MKQLILLLIASVLGSVSLLAQKAVYLKNGSIIKGKLLQQTPDVHIETYDQSMFVFKAEEVLKIVDAERPNPNIVYKERGFVHYTELGPLAGSNRASNGVTTSAFSFQTVNGYKFNQWLYTGLSVGADLYAVQTFIPVMLSVRGDFTQKGNKIPFYFVEGGYGINATSNDVAGISYKGGGAFAAGLGLKLLFSGNTGFVTGIGYRFQRSSVGSVGKETIEDFGRITLRAGFSF